MSFYIFANFFTQSAFAVENVNQEVDLLSSSNFIGEELIDAAIMHCQKGEDLNKNLLLHSILEQLSPPENVKQLILKLIEKDCNKYLTNKSNQTDNLFIIVGVGYDSNVNQGIASRTMTLHTEDFPITLELGDSYLPASSKYTELGVIKNIKISEQVELNISANNKNYDELKNYSYLSTNFSLIGKVPKLSNHTQWYFDKNHIWMNGTYYLNTFSLGIEQAINSDATWQLTSSIRKKNYLTEKSQNSLSFNLGSLKYFNWSKTNHSHIGLRLFFDNSNNLRPGGNRKGWNFSASHILGLNDWILKLQYQRQYWKTKHDFSPYLIPERRKNQSTNFLFSAQYPISSKKILVAEIQKNISKDNIVLYNHKKWNLGLTYIQSF